jgi:tetratricopeptide (TPR) repeat protein
MIPNYIRISATAVLAALTALVLSRGSIADSLVVRGDALLYGSRPERSLEYYRRAIAIDSANATALDRFAFGALMQRNASTVSVAVTLCTAFLRRRPKDATIRFDRALLFRAGGDVRRAEVDFALAGRANRDPRAMTFAGLSARVLGRIAEERRYLRAALSYSPNFLPARRALLKAVRVR